MHEKKFSSASSDVCCLSRSVSRRIPASRSCVCQARRKSFAVPSARTYSESTEGLVLDFAEANGATKLSASCRHTMTEIGLRMKCTVVVSTIGYATGMPRKMPWRYLPISCCSLPVFPRAEIAGQEISTRGNLQEDLQERESAKKGCAKRICEKRSRKRDRKKGIAKKGRARLQSGHEAQKEKRL